MKTEIPLFLRLARGATKVTLAASLAFLLTQPATAGLTHRYSFTNDVTDSVGGANGTLMGAATVSDGVANFPGASHDDYVNLPPGLISNYTTVTFEVWMNAGPNQNWLEVYAFGTQTADLLGANMVMFCPHSGSAPPDFRMSYAQAAPGYTDEKVVNGIGTLDNLGEVFVACVYDPPNNSMSLYTNGTLVATLAPVTTGAKQFSLTNVYNQLSWLGRSLYNGDAPYNGTIDEFRINDKALTPLQVYVDNVAGPNTVVTNIVINSLSWNVKTNMVVGSRQSSTVTFNTASYGSVTLPNATEPTYSSSDTTILKVTPQGQIFALATGSATVFAVYNGTTNTAAMTVSPPQLVHRYSFTTDANDSVGTANGTLAGSASVSGGSLILPGGGVSADIGASYLDLPNGILTNLTAATFEAWVTDTGSGTWARIWDFGNSAGGEDISDTGSRFVFVTLPNGGGNIQGTIHINDRGGDAAVTGPRPPVGQQAHVVWSSDIANQTSWLYVNGTLVAVNTGTTVSPADIGVSVNNWLGRSQYAGDALFTGSINEFRIYDGAVSDLQVSLDAASGPDKIVTDPGALQTLRLTIGTNVVTSGGYPVQMLAIADFANITNVNVTTLSGTLFTTSDPNVVTVNKSGVLLGAGPGTATLGASYGGQSASLSLTVTNLPGYTKATLVHRYSFSESPGSTTVKDSVGTADGTIAGNGASFNGNGQLSLPGGTSSSADPVAGYVDLPNHIINVLTNASFEAWVTIDVSSQWQRIFDFGTSAGGEGVSDGSGNYLFLSNQGSGNNYQFSVRDPATGSEPAPLIAGARLPVGQQVFVAVVYDHADNVAQLYSNATLVAYGTAPVDLTTIDDVNNWLGRSQWGDPMFQGSYDEFRIYDGVLLPSEIAAHYASGPQATAPLPTLTAAKVGQNLVVSWPASATGFNLQSSLTLGSTAAWTAVPTAPVVVNGFNQVTVPITGQAAFYRLIKQ